MSNVIKFWIFQNITRNFIANVALISLWWIFPFSKNPQLSLVFTCKVPKFLLYLHRRLKSLCISTQAMQQTIADYFKTQPVLKAWLFGSYARGEETPQSDVDILFIPDRSQHFSLFTMGGMYEDLKELLGKEVDLITDGGLMPFARESADRDKILIYERGNPDSRLSSG